MEVNIKKSKTNYDLTTGSVAKTLVAFALPFLFASFMQAFYGAVDLFVVGRFASSSAVSAVTIGSQILYIITAMVLGLSMGTTVMLGRKMGEKKEKELASILGNSILIFLVLAIILTPLMLWQAPNLVSLVQTPKKAVLEARQYITICSAGIPFIIGYNVISGILRGLGDSKTPMFFIGIACIINVILDFFLTGFLSMGTLGTAYATVIAQAVSFIYAFFYIKKHGLPFPFTKKDIRWEKSSIINILTLGVPIASQDFLIQISFMVITIIANERGLVDSAAVGIVEKIIHFAFLVPSSFLSAISAITAQNAGAGKEKRSIQTLKYGIYITGCYGIIMCIIFQLVPQFFTSFFSTDAKVILSGSTYLRSYCIDCFLAGVTFSLNGYLCGINKSLIPFIHNVISIFLVRIPLAYILSKSFSNSLFPMGLASPIGSLTSLLIIIFYFKVIYKKPTSNTI